MVHIGQAFIACVSVLNNIPMDKMLDYVSGSTSTIMCFIIPFVFYYKYLITLPKCPTGEKWLYIVLIVFFSFFQVLKIASFIVPEYFTWM